MVFRERRECKARRDSIVPCGIPCRPVRLPGYAGISRPLRVTYRLMSCLAGSYLHKPWPTLGVRVLSARRHPAEAGKNANRRIDAAPSRGRSPIGQQKHCVIHCFISPSVPSITCQVDCQRVEKAIRRTGVKRRASKSS